MKATDIRPGNAIMYEGQLYLVTNLDHVKPGKGPAYAQVKLKTVPGGSVIEKRLRTSEDVEQAILDRREMEYLYSDAAAAVFMDLETFEQTPVQFDDLGDQRLYLQENMQVIALVHEGNLISIELPAVVEMKIAETAPQVKGATATNQLKEAVMESGLKTRVPPFIETGEIIKIKTDTGEYMGRAGSS